MKKCDLHTHSLFCDGNDKPEDMVLSAIGMGLERLGICAHSYVAFDRSYCLDEARYPEFQAEMRRLKARYAGKIELLCGIEQDFYSQSTLDGFDYVIGSVHYLKLGGDYFSVDESPEKFEEGCRKYFGGDYYALCEAYFDTVGKVAEKTNCDIIGHFDLVAKFNERGGYFDESAPRYLSAARAALDALLPFGKPFEVNTGAISRGYNTAPYPAKPISDYILSRGGRLILSSDSHSKENIAFMFDKLESAYPT